MNKQYYETFGNTHVFAVSYELNQDYGDSWLFGKFCYWIGGMMVGDYEMGTSLRDMIMVLASIVRDNENREDYYLSKLTTEELYNRLNNSLFGNETENSKYNDIAQDECWSRFDICPAIDIFDCWSIYLVDSPPESKIVYSYLEEKGNIVEVNLEAGFFDRVIKEAYNRLLNIYEIEVTNQSAS
jgi:hypothetical protein